MPGEPLTLVYPADSAQVIPRARQSSADVPDCAQQMKKLRRRMINTEGVEPIRNFFIVLLGFLSTNYRAEYAKSHALLLLVGLLLYVQEELHHHQLSANKIAKKIDKYLF